MKKNQNVVNTIEAQTALESIVTELQTAIAADLPVSKVDALRHRASQALSALNKCRQADAFALARDNSAPIVALSEMGVYSACSFTFDKKTGAPVFSDRDALLSLDAFVTSSGDITADAMWRGAVKDAVHLSIIKLAQGMKKDIPALMLRMKVSSYVANAVKNGKKNKDGEMSYEVVQLALQTALDSIIYDTGDRDDGKNMYRVNRQACRWLEASYGINGTTGAIVCPRDGGMYDRMFFVLRHVVANMPLDIEVAKEMAKESK